jgi:hypothetical protein
MNMFVYDQGQLLNDYLTLKFFKPLLFYGKETGRPISVATQLQGIKNSTILAHDGHFTKEAIAELKNDGNRLIAFHINDSSYLGDMHVLKDVDLIFKFSGIQQTRTSPEIRISDSFEYTIVEREILPNGTDWADYCELRDAGKLIPLPYPPYYHRDTTPIPFENKDGKVCMRGGNHYLRFHLFLNLLKHGLASAHSEFSTDVYFYGNTDPNYRYCPDCLEAHRADGKVTFARYKSTPSWGCNNAYMTWQGEPEPGFFQNANTHRWNNKCVPLFYWLTEQFEKYHGPVDKALLEHALNGRFLPEPEFYDLLRHSVFSGDYKWMFSVDIPPRFWQVASARVINLLPKWTRNQTEFPELIEGDHYIGFAEDFSDLASLRSITKEQHDHITNNCFELYNHWIKPDRRYDASIALMDYIFARIG